MPLYLPRRHRRPLLFPPGLLALAGLLWLGCVALGPWRESQLRRYSVLPLTMPMLPLPTNNMSITSVRFDVPSLAKVRAMGPWRNNYLTGKPENKLQEQSRIITEIHTIMADSGHRGRVSVSLAPTTHYKDLVFLLDLVNREKVKRYWFDIVHEPTTFYVSTEVRNRFHLSNYPGAGFCGTSYLNINIIPPATPVPSFWATCNDWLDGLWHLTWLQPLMQPEWRASAWFLAAIITLGSWRIIVPRRTPQTP